MFMSAKIRKVGSADLKDILVISKQTWGGFDYLPNVIDEWLRDQNSYTCGVEVNGKLVALANLRVIENEKTGWMEGLRVHEKHRGKGYANLLTEHVIEEGEKRKVDRLRYTTGSDNAASLKLASKHGFSRILELGVFWHPSITTKSSPTSELNVREVGFLEANSLLAQNPTLLPNGILVYDWKALDFSKENLETIAKSHKFFMASKQDQLDSFSMAYPRPQAKFKIWMMTIYARDFPSLLEQFAYNKSEARKNGCKALMCTVQTEFEEPLRKAKIIYPKRWRTHLVLLERTLFMIHERN